MQEFIEKYKQFYNTCKNLIEQSAKISKHKKKFQKNDKNNHQVY